MAAELAKQDREKGKKGKKKKDESISQAVMHGKNPSTRNAYIQRPAPSECIINSNGTISKTETKPAALRGFPSHLPLHPPKKAAAITAKWKKNPPIFLKFWHFLLSFCFHCPHQNKENSFFFFIFLFFISQHSKLFRSNCYHFLLSKISFRKICIYYSCFNTF